MIATSGSTKYTHLFENLPQNIKQLLILNGTELIAEKGTMLFNEGDSSDHIYYIQSGKIRLSKTSVQGKVFYMQVKKEYDFVGELTLYNGYNYHLNAEVVQDSVLFRFDRKTIEDLFFQHSDLAMYYMKWLAKENQTLLAQFRDLIFCGKEGAVYSILIRMSNEYGKKISNGILINRKVTNQELANFVGATRESINRILKRLINHNIISVNTKYITILNKQYLEEHLRCNHCPFDECHI
ncbi:Crp/Fnr family transcriptional regulator [Evansella cellulosilytica]|uniref:Transcriptional regulator, Crp/Fnr family n=1 Tax=Evansella cellulosilytica (strain ATCC 21833 / DSM 2522 / FERM P-1141 / JCM 9156 / N-4) TaxID=649639 RepID=E6TY25_EVAC2|nr:Crp/Fnr family transcriptional regulator [Evansella cellulosilytica]ADU31238.1 transcriptional regulator, Crp/Fnr family [Evansella cellulosilytica DSM 2522]